MGETLLIDKQLSTSKIYEALLPQIEALLNPEEPLISNLSNFTAVLKDTFEKISWVGFYFLKENKLYLGPFQGKIACTIIQVGNGVCGTSAAKKETIIVNDVDEFPGHIACDAGSKSEIVVPLSKDNLLFGVLDLDSYQLASFNCEDKVNLEKLCSTLINRLNFSQLNQLLN
jgi:L-methionine (R)-S-oxide reductase